jgi:hypothetical protein
MENFVISWYVERNLCDVQRRGFGDDPFEAGPEIHVFYRKIGNTDLRYIILKI